MSLVSTPGPRKEGYCTTAAKVPLDNVAMKTRLAACVLVVTCAPAIAQERGQVGIAMGYPNSMSVIWHVTDRVAIQPKISFAQSATETSLESELTVNGVVVSTSRMSTSSDGWSAAPGVNLLFYMGRWDNVSTYVSPGYAYARGSSTTTTTVQSLFGGSQSQTREYSTDSHEARGVFGVQFTPHRRFAVFGETGLRYSRSSGSPSGDSSTRVIGNTSAVGAIFYF